MTRSSSGGDNPYEADMTQGEMRRALEAVLFIADESIPSADLAVLFEVPTARIEEEMSALADDLERSGRGVVLRQVAGGWRMSTHPDASQYLERFVAEGRGGRISNAALETLAIVAYRQPVSRATIGEIRGVASEGVLKTLVARGVVEEVGRDEGPGQAILYGTTHTFLERMGLDSLGALPSLAGFMPDPSDVERMESGLGPGM